MGIVDKVYQTRMFTGDVEDELLDAAIMAWVTDERFPPVEWLDVEDDTPDGGWDESED